jgi:Protein of unknown function (DUF2909)
MLAKIFIVSMLLLILTALGFGLFALIQDKGQSNRTVKALTWRIALSLTLFALIILGFAFGIIRPHAPGF